MEKFVNLHMNNGRYLTIMDIGRFDLIMRMGPGQSHFKTGSEVLTGMRHPTLLF